jgi:peptidoglycan hydrolase CwlO-like protein
VHVEKLRLDRFGACANLQLDSLTDGMNVFFGPEGTGKKTLVYFLRAMLYGFQPSIRRRFLNGGSSHFGGTLTVVGPAGKSTINRHDDGTTDGKVTVEHNEAAPVARNDLSDILPRISSTAFERFYAIDFDRRPSLKELWDEAQRCGIDVHARSADAVRLDQLHHSLRQLREDLAALPSPDAAIESLRQRRRGLAAEIQAAQSRAEAERIELARRRKTLAEDIASVERQIDSMRRELSDLLRTIAQGEGHRTELMRALQASLHSPPPGEKQMRLQEIDARLERWRSVLREMGLRRHTLQSDSGDQAIRNTGIVNRPRDPRHHLRSVESQLAKLEAMALSFESSTQCRCEQMREMLRETTRTLREDVYRLCRELNTWEADVQQRESSGELAMLTRCEAELDTVIRGLTTQRSALVEEIRMECGDTSHLPTWERHLCGCQDHPRAVRIDPASQVHKRELEAVEAELDRLARRKEKMQHDIDDLDAERDDLVDQLRTVDERVDEHGEKGLAEQIAELARIDEMVRIAERREEIEQAISAVEREIEQITSSGAGADLIQNAAVLLRRMSAGNLIGLNRSSSGDLAVLNEHGTRLDYESLSEGQKNLVYVSLCLEMVTVLQRRGVDLPIVLSGLFTHLDSKLVPETAEVLCSFANLGQQVVVLTRFEHVASVFRLLNVRVRNLEPVRLAADAILADSSRGMQPWNSEEFAGESSGRIPNADGNRDGFGDESDAASGEKTVFHLTESHSIEHAPSIDRTNVDRLRKIGILRVGDLLRVAPAAVASELRYAGITAEMFANWQAQARLVCQVPNLRPYDARILVACGIVTPAALRGVSHRELREMVRDFASSPDGQAVLLSGTEYELSRVTEWIKAARRDYEATKEEARLHSHGDSDASDESEGTGAGEPGRQTGSRRAGKGSESGRSSRKAVRAPSDDDRILKMPNHEEWRFFLGRRSPIVDAPSIGSRTAEQLSAVGVKTVADLLKVNPDDLAARLQNRRIHANVIRQWQQQTILACRIPQLRGHDAQILVGIGITEPEQLAGADADELFEQVQSFIETKEGKRVTRLGSEPDLAEVREWINWSSAARSLNAA